MTDFTERLDRFVRWFFDSSPTVLVEPREPVPSCQYASPRRATEARAGETRRVER